MRLFALAGASWAASTFLSLGAFVIGALYAGRGMQRMPVALAIFFGGMALSMLAAIFVVHKGAVRFGATTGAHVVAVLVFSTVQLMTFALVGFMGLVGLNR